MPDVDQKTFKTLKALDEHLFIIDVPDRGVWAANRYMIWSLDAEYDRRVRGMLASYNLDHTVRGHIELASTARATGRADVPTKAVTEYVLDFVLDKCVPIQPMTRGGLHIEAVDDRGNRRRIWEAENHVTVLDDRFVEFLKDGLNDGGEGSWCQATDTRLVDRPVPTHPGAYICYYVRGSAMIGLLMPVRVDGIDTIMEPLAGWNED